MYIILVFDSLFVISINLISPLIWWSSTPKPIIGLDCTYTFTLRESLGANGYICLNGTRGIPVVTGLVAVPDASGQFAVSPVKRYNS
jgi:hypothetical protein